MRRTFGATRRRYFLELLQSKQVDAAARVMSSCAHLSPWDNGHVIPIEDVISAYNIRITRQDLIGSGRLLCHNKDYEIIVNAGANDVTQRYTLAHELGHWLLVREFGIDEAVAMSEGCFQASEDACERFAALVLIPDRLLERWRSELERDASIAALERMSRHLRVPLRAVLYRMAMSGLNRGDQAFLVVRPVIAASDAHIEVWYSVLPAGLALPVNSDVRGIGLGRLADEWHRLEVGRELKYVAEIKLSVASPGPVGSSDVETPTVDEERESYLPRQYVSEVSCKRYDAADGAFGVVRFRLSERK